MSKHKKAQKNVSNMKSKKIRRVKGFETKEYGDWERQIVPIKWHRRDFVDKIMDNAGHARKKATPWKVFLEESTYQGTRVKNEILTTNKIRTKEKRQMKAFSL